MTESRLRSAIATLAVAGLGIAAYMTCTRYSGGQLFCATGGCETVQRSRYATVEGIPVAVVGVAGYLALLATTAFRGSRAAAAGVGIAVVAVLFSTYLLLAQVVLIHAVCRWCVAGDVVVSLLAVLTIARFALARRLEGGAAGNPQSGKGLSAATFSGGADGARAPALETRRKARA